MARKNTNKDIRTTNSALGCETEIHFPRRPSNSSLRHSSFVPHVALESEVWIADAPGHLIHFNCERLRQA